MKHWWWKILGVALLLFASIAGLWVPLSPALIHVSPDRIAPGHVEISITGYNTAFGPNESVRLENDGQLVCATKAFTHDATHLTAGFLVPDGMRASLTDVMVGDLRYPDALFTEGLGKGFASQECPSDMDTANSIPPHTGFFFPNRSILYESIRNLHFHVPMWFTMMWLMTATAAADFSPSMPFGRTRSLSWWVIICFQKVCCSR